MDALLDILFDIRIAGIFLAVIFPVVFYLYYTRNHDYWEKRSVPHAKPIVFFGSRAKSFKSKIEDIELERYNELGRIYGVYEGNKPGITIAEPELLRNILVKDFQYFSNRRELFTGDPITDKMLSFLRGDDWKRVRTIMSPTFSTGKIKKIMSIFHDCAKSLLQNLKMESSKNESFDILRIYRSLTMDVIASSAFSTKIDSLNDPENPFVKMANGAFGKGITLQLLFFVYFPKLMSLFGYSFFGKKNMLFFKKVTLEIIKERKRTNQKRNDFLQLMMDTAEETVKEEKGEENTDDILSNYGDDPTNQTLFKSSISKRLSMDELVSQCVSFFLAGYHTAATTLGVTTYLLALNQEEQEKVFQEIKEVLEKTDGILTYEAIPKMKYLDNVISETMRMYTPVYRLERQAEADYKLGDTGITIPKGMIVGIPVFAMHRDPKYFPEPEKFNPDRFSPEEKESLIPYTFLPFGAGPRNCLGMRFALLELKICLTYVFSTYKVHKSSKTKIPLETGNGLGLLSPCPINIRLEERKDCPLKQ